MRLEPPYDPTDGRDYIRSDTSSVSDRMHFVRRRWRRDRHKGARTTSRVGRRYFSAASGGLTSTCR